MKFSKLQLYNFLILLSIIILGIFIDISHVSVFLVLLCYMYISFITEKKSSLHMMFFLGYSSFIFLPALLNWYYLDTSFNLYFISSFVSYLFLFFTRNTKVRFFIDYGSPVRNLFKITTLILIASIFMDYGEIISSLFVLLIILMSLSFKQNEFKNNIVYLILFISVFLIYSIFYWSGFGRTVLFGWLLLALLQFSYSIDFRVNKYFFGLFPGLASTLISDRDLLNLNFSGFESALSDSAFGPYRLASTFIEYSNSNGLDFVGFWNQILFTFFIFVPREIWTEKPYGFGFYYTVQHFDTSLINAGHSIAATLIGEHIYFLGYLGIFTSVLIFMLVAWISNILYRIKGLNGNGVLVFSASMMVLAWGGMTSFSARVALPTLVFLIFVLLLKPLLFRRFKFI